MAGYTLEVKLSGWQYRSAATQIGSGRVRSGRGIAAMWYEGRSGYAAVVAQTSVDTKTGKISVDHLWTTQDCGPVVNPFGMKMQAEGCAVQGTSRALNTLPGAFDFQAINRPLEPVVGAGETSLTAVPAAIANSIFDATGARLRQIPFTPARVRAALAV